MEEERARGQGGLLCSGTHGHHGCLHKIKARQHSSMGQGGTWELPPQLRRYPRCPLGIGEPVFFKSVAPGKVTTVSQIACIHVSMESAEWISWVIEKIKTQTKKVEMEWDLGWE